MINITFYHQLSTTSGGDVGQRSHSTRAPSTSRSPYSYYDKEKM